jgi:hypothetical protein
MFFKKIVAVYCNNHKKYVNTLCGNNAVFHKVTVSDPQDIFENALFSSL